MVVILWGKEGPRGRSFLVKKIKKLMSREGKGPQNKKHEGQEVDKKNGFFWGILLIIK